jgi:MYXO-CTERM domain-containing protein
MRSALARRAATLLFALALPASAFPGVLVAKDDAPRAVSSTALVLMQHQGVAVVTLFAEYRGPLTAFAFVMPVPPDVSVRAVRTVKRSLLARVEAVSAPRFHRFYEQDPCDGGDVQQSWDEHLKAQGPGFLAPPGLPPLDRHYAVSNAIGLPVEPTFKGAESEFRYQELAFKAPEALRASLAASGYRIDDAALSALARAVHAGHKLLLAEVSLAHVELAPGDRVKLGGIRFVTHALPAASPEALGALAAHEAEDWFAYVLARGTRYEVQNQENAFVPASIAVAPPVAEHLATAYDALFDAFAARHPRAFVSEYAWSTSGCGEPCPDVPLAPDELLTLGGDVLEAETTTAKERSPTPSPEPTLDRERFETHLAELMPKERPAAEREHQSERREIERRRALAARQTYVLTRLHRRYAASAERADVAFAPAAPVSGGVGVPKGARGELSSAVTPAAENRLQVRFVSLAPWEREVACAEPHRFRWGKRWASEARVSRAVPLALDLSSASREPSVLRSALVRPIAELGLTPSEKVATAVPAPALTPSATNVPSTKRTSGCAVGRPRAGPSGGWLVFALFGALVRRRRWQAARTLRGPHAARRSARGSTSSF